MWTRITPQEARQWKKAAIRLARAIIRFQRNEWMHVHTDSTINFAEKTLDKVKRV